MRFMGCVIRSGQNYHFRKKTEEVFLPKKKPAKEAG
jgi:hypothetical protein